MLKYHQEIHRHLSILGLLGISLICLAVFVPDAGHHPVCSFFKGALSSSWRKPLEMMPARCSVRIILSSLGLFLVIESLGTILAVLKRRKLALLVYLTHLVPCFGMMLGIYCLAKSLL